MIDWLSVAKRLGYSSEHEMWFNLYIMKELTFSALAKRFSVSHIAVREAVLRARIPIRPRGGAMRGRDPRWPDDAAFLKEVEQTGYAAVAERLGFSFSAVYKRTRALRKPKAAPPQ
jgi:hypothetical protein